MLSFIIAAFLFIGCGAKDADTADTAAAPETTDTAAEEQSSSSHVKAAIKAAFFIEQYLSF